MPKMRASLRTACRSPSCYASTLGCPEWRDIFGAKVHSAEAVESPVDHLEGDLAGSGQLEADEVAVGIEVGQQPTSHDFCAGAIRFDDDLPAAPG